MANTNANTTKVTKRQVLEAMAERADIMEVEMFKNYIEHEIELLNNKKTSRKPSKTQVANIPIKEEIVRVLSENPDGLTVTEIVKAGNYGEGVEVSTQKITSLAGALIKEGKIVNEREGKKSLYKIA